MQSVIKWLAVRAARALATERVAVLAPPALINAPHFVWDAAIALLQAHDGAVQLAPGCDHLPISAARTTDDARPLLVAIYGEPLPALDPGQQLLLLDLDGTSHDLPSAEHETSSMAKWREAVTY